MPGGFPYTYFKVAPSGFAATVYDTDDLSITRGSSLTLLAMPGLLQVHLADTFPNLTFDWIQSSASELLFCCAVPNEAPAVTIKKVKGKAPAGVKASKWNKALQAKANKIKASLSDDALRGAAAEIATDFSVNGEGDAIAGRILAKCGNTNTGPRQLSSDQCAKLASVISDFTGSEQAGYPFDLMLFNTVWFQPDRPNLTPADAFAALETRLGHARLQRLGCVVPPAAAVGGLSADKAVCQFTGILAAGGEQEKQRPTSPNARRRREVGRKMKAGFYQGILDGAKKAASEHDLQGNTLVASALTDIDKATGKVTGFANDFSEIVADAPDHLPISLKSNLCVLNMDGNSFGGLRAGMADMDRYRRFSAYLDILKAGMLARILNWIADENSGMLHGGTARFETLLWGGDEFTFVLPAWKGWELATVIHEAVKDWETLSGKPMTFATGLVFGPHKAPIRDLKKAAEDLANMAKSDKTKAVWQAVAYESVDRVHFAPKTYRRDWLGKKVKAKHFNLPADLAIALPEKVKGILSAVSRTQLHKIYYDKQEWLACHAPDTTEIKKQIAKVAPTMPDGELSDITELLIPAGNYPLLRFAQVNLLLDYIQPEAGRG